MTGICTGRQHHLGEGVVIGCLLEKLQDNAYHRLLTVNIGGKLELLYRFQATFLAKVAGCAKSFEAGNGPCKFPKPAWTSRPVPRRSRYYLGSLNPKPHYG